MLHILHLGHRVDRFEVLKREISNQGINRYKVWDGIYNPQQPTIAIAQSHKMIVEYAKNQNLESITIAEDDICFTAPGAYQYYNSQMPSDFDLYLGGITSGDVNTTNIVSDFSGLTLYTIHRKFYSIFLELPLNTNIDRGLKALGKYVVCAPMVAKQHNGYSDNRQEYCDYTECYRNKIFFR